MSMPDSSDSPVLAAAPTAMTATAPSRAYRCDRESIRHDRWAVRASSRTSDRNRPKPGAALLDIGALDGSIAAGAGAARGIKNTAP